jgi:hypothetical protein
VNSPVEGPSVPPSSPQPATPSAPRDATPVTSANSPLVATTGTTSGDACPSCGSHMAPDQRYCLECGNRRGDPRLPFMDAVVFMEAVKAPPQSAAAATPPAPRSEKRSSISANASLIAGVGTLLLALGIGVLIGKTGESSSSNAGAAPSVIRVGGGTGGETASTETSSETAGGGKKGGATASAGSAAVKAKAKEKAATGASGTSKAAEEVLKPTGDVKFAPETIEKGESCEEGAAGCEGGKFNGSFFE